jgi:LCP family protein required for cell wall assembly
VTSPSRGVNVGRHGRSGIPRSRPLRVVLAALAVLAVVAVGYGLASAGSLAMAWGAVERVSLEQMPVGKDESSGSDEPGSAQDQNPAALRASAAPPTVVALVGTDSRSGLDDLDDFGDFDTANADVILLAIRTGDEWTLLSIPRDLYVDDLCDGGLHKIGEAFQGCENISGLSMVVAELERATGLDIAHAAAVDLAGFQQVVDILGGYELCTEVPLRDQKSGLDMGAGCTLADGEQTLQWLRSRHTQEQVEGVWRTADSVSDLTRNQRQRQFLLDMFERVTAGASPDTMLDLVNDVAPFVTIDDRLSLTNVAAWGWQLRSTGLETAEIPVEFAATAEGASVLVPTVDVRQFIADLTATR